MKIETLKERIAKAEQKIQNKRNTIDKKTGWIAKRKANLSNKTMTENDRYWETCEINHLEDDILRLDREIKEVESSLEGYRAQLTEELEKAASRNVPAILEFLEGWKQRVFAHYDENLVPCYETMKAVRALGKETNNFRYGTPEYKAAQDKYEKAYAEYHEKTCGYYVKEEYVNPWGRTCERSRKVKEGEWEYLHPYNSFKTYEEGTAKLKEDLEQEANRKYDFIIERVNAICGKITDASFLTVGAKGDLNGYIKGERGRASVQTIGAGGYNIQCFHFRTLIHELK